MTTPNTDRPIQDKPDYEWEFTRDEASIILAALATYQTLQHTSANDESLTSLRRDLAGRYAEEAGVLGAQLNRFYFDDMPVMLLEVE